MSQASGEPSIEDRDRVEARRAMRAEQDARDERYSRVKSMLQHHQERRIEIAKRVLAGFAYRAADLDGNTKHYVETALKVADELIAQTDAVVGATLLNYTSDVDEIAEFLTNYNREVVLGDDRLESIRKLESERDKAVGRAEDLERQLKRLETPGSAAEAVKAAHEAASAQLEASIAATKECDRLRSRIQEFEANMEAKSVNAQALVVALEDERKLKDTFKNYWHESAEKAEKLERERSAAVKTAGEWFGDLIEARNEVFVPTVAGPIVCEHLGNLTDLARPELCDQPPCWCHDEARKLTAWPEGAASGPRRLHLGRRGLSGYFGCDNDSCWCHEPSPVPRP